jgi:hypothetical protein
MLQGEDIVENESLLLAAKAANMKDSDIQKCFKLMDDSTVKLALKKSTEDAIEHGVYLLFKFLSPKISFPPLTIVDKFTCIQNITLNIYLIILGFRRTYHCCSLQG